MKTLVLAVVAIIMSSGAFASDINPERETPIVTEQQVQNGDFYLMQDKKMWLVRNGEKTELTEDATLQNGTVVKTDGTVQPKEGDAIALEENQYIDSEGNVGTLPQSE